MLTVRAAGEKDADQILAFDEVGEVDPGRRDFIRRVISAGTCYVAVDEGCVRGYAVFDYTFFEQGFVALLYVSATARRHRVGSALMQYLEDNCESPRLFTSTNLSNQPMQRLLARLGYKLSGVIHDLDEGDPELIYVKYLRGTPDRALPRVEQDAD
jgi:GNAT superfamily N-acetyltransferase